MCVCSWSDLTVKTLALIGKIASRLPLRLKAPVFPSAGGVTRGWGEALSVTVQRAAREAGPAWRPREGRWLCLKPLQTSDARQTSAGRQEQVHR